MTTRRPKTRTVFCRICDKDYTRLMELCETQDACISDLLRTAVDNLLKGDHEAENTLLSYVLSLTFKVETISKEIENLRISTLASFHGLSRQLTIPGTQSHGLPSGQDH